MMRWLEPGLMLSRRKFIGWSGTAAAMWIAPTWSLKGSTADGAPLGTSAPRAFGEHVGLDPDLRDHMPRTSTWQRIDGSAILTLSEEHIEMSNPLGIPERFDLDELHCGQPQEIIRRVFDDNVLQELLGEVDRRRVSAG